MKNLRIFLTGGTQRTHLTHLVWVYATVKST